MNKAAEKITESHCEIPSNFQKIISTNPSRGYEVIGSVEITSREDIARIVDCARNAQPAWQAVGVVERCRLMTQLLEVFRAHGQEIIEQTSREMGMPLKLSRVVFDDGAAELAWNIQNAPAAMANKILYEDDKEISEQMHEPYGVMACVAPWNFPFGNFARAVATSLLAGNCVVMKYSEEIPFFSKLLERLIEESRILPSHVMNFIYGSGQAGADLCDQNIDLISFTGSTQTGRKIYGTAAQKLIPVCLELGGSSPGIVFADADLNPDVMAMMFRRRFANSGQFCSGLKRLMVHESRLDECVEKLAALAKKAKLGDALDPETDLGPLVAERQVEKLESQIADAVKKGARLICGGKRPAGLNGAYFEPTILVDVSKDMQVWGEEVFGPALSVISFTTYEEAIALANDTEYGLSAFVYSTSAETLRRAFADLKAGSMDDGIANFQRPCNPFGGYKHSGIGRQRGFMGFEDVCQTKVKSYRK